MVLEFVLTRYDNVNGKVNFSWGPVKNMQFPRAMIDWDYTWLRREASKLKIGEKKIYHIDGCTYQVLDENDEKIKNFILDTTIWITDWKFHLNRLIKTIKTKIDWILLPKAEKERIKHMWDGIRIVPMRMTTVPRDEIDEIPMESPTGNIHFLDFKNNFTKE